MEQYSMKRRIAAVLAMAMLSGCMPFAALAEATPGETQAEQIVPTGTDDEKKDEQQNEITPLSDEDNGTVNVFAGASAVGYDASLDTASDGRIEGSVAFSGATMVVKLYKDGSQIKDKKLSGSGSFAFTGLSAGSYAVRFYFWGEGKLPPQDEIVVTIGYQDVEKKDDESKDDESKEDESKDDESKDDESKDDESKDDESKDDESKDDESKDDESKDDESKDDESKDDESKDNESKDDKPQDTGDPDPEAEAVYTDSSFSSTEASSATAADGTIIGSVTYTGDKTVVVKLYSEEDPQTKLTHKSIKKSGDSVTFTGLAPGNYRLDVHFYGGGVEASKTVTVGYKEEETGGKDDPVVPVKAFTEVNCTATKASAEGAKDGKITGSVSYTGESIVVVKLYAASDLSSKIAECKIKTSGESFSFDGLAAGAYKVDFHFYGEAASESRTVEVGTEKPAAAKIAITNVTGGENKLTVKGTAQADAQILVSAEPSGAKAEVLTVGSDGAFSADLVAEPGTYTKVTACYVTDVTSAVSAGGTFTVTAPAAAPTLTVDPVDINSTKVVAKTAAGVVVTLTTKDSSQTLTADADGIVRFSLAHTYLKGDTFTLTVVYGPGSGQSFSQKVTVGGIANYNDLEYGDTGDDVLRLTTRLHELGYPVSPTTRYGSTVREAVRLFQIANGIKANGRAGDTMQAALYSVSAIAYGEAKYPTLVRGDKGLALIYTLQQRLKDLGYYTIKVDGIFGSGTQRAVRLFQRVNGLPETGKADNATQTLLYSSAAKPADGYVSGDYTTLSRSNKYKSAVVPLQRRLKSLGYYSGSIDGYFGSQTYRAVRNFQSRNGLSVTGVADPYTQEILYSSSAIKASGSSSGSSSSTGYRLLYWGCRGDAVKRLQNALIDAGYKSIVRKADGIFGQWTYDAVKAYQKDHGLAADGIAGKNTQNSLYGTSY